MGHLDWERSLLLTVALLFCLIVAFPGATDLRTALALPLLFYSPGHMILRLFRQKYSSTLEYVAYAFGLSIATAILGGFLLHVMGLMRPLPWLIWLAFVSIAAWAVGGRELSRADGRFFAIRFALARREALMFAAAALLLLGTLTTVRYQTSAHSEFKYTQFWIVAEDPSRPSELTIGLENKEDKAASYDIEIMVGGLIAAKLPRIQLEPGEIWTTPFVVASTVNIAAKSPSIGLQPGQIWTAPFNNTAQSNVSGKMPSARLQAGETSSAASDRDAQYNISPKILSAPLQPSEIWVAPLNAAAPGKGVQRVEAWLFKDGDQRTIYRRVWADITSFTRGQQ